MNVKKGFFYEKPKIELIDFGRDVVATSLDSNDETIPEPDWD